MAIISGYNENQIISFVMDTWSRLKRARSTKQVIWMDCLRAYMRYHDDEKWVAYAKANGLSHRFFAATWDAVENLAATLGQSVWKYPDWMSIEPAPHQEGGVDYDDTASEHLAKGLEYYFRIDGGQRKAKQAIKMLALTGNQPMTVQWKMEPATDYPAYMAAMQQYQAENEIAWAHFQQEVSQWQQVEQQAAQMGQAPPPKPQFNTPHPPLVQPTVAYEGPTIVVDDLFNFVIDEPSAVGRPIRIKRVVKPLAWLKKYSKRQSDGYILYENLGRVQDGEVTPQTGSESDEQAIRAQIFGMQAQPRQGVVLHEIQGDMVFAATDDPGDKVFMSWIGTIANSNTLIRWEPTYLASGRCPTFLSKLIEIPGESYGMGLIEAAVDLQDLLNRRVNQIVDGVSAAIYPETKEYDDGVIDLGRTTGPGKRSLVGDLNNIQPIVKDLRGLQLGFQDVQMILRFFQQMTRSANPYVDPGSESTATEVQRNEGLKSVAFNDLVESVESTLIVPIMDLFVDHISMFSHDGVMALVTQDGQRQWVKVSPEVVRRGWLVKPQGSKRANEEQRRIQNLLMFVELVTGNPVIMELAMMTGMVDISRLVREVWKELDIGGEEKVFRDVAPAEIQALAMQMMVQKGAQGEDTGRDGAQGNQVPALQGQAAPGGVGAGAFGANAAGVPLLDGWGGR